MDLNTFQGRASACENLESKEATPLRWWNVEAIVYAGVKSYENNPPDR